MPDDLARCPICRTANDEDARFCKQCGARIVALGGTAETAPRAYTPPHLAAKILRSRQVCRGSANR